MMAFTTRRCPRSWRSPPRARALFPGRRSPPRPGPTWSAAVRSRSAAWPPRRGRPASASVGPAEGRLQQALAVLAAPVGDQARVEPLPTQQGPLLARLRAPVVLGQDGQLVLGREDPTHRVTSGTRDSHRSRCRRPHAKSRPRRSLAASFPCEILHRPRAQYADRRCLTHCGQRGCRRRVTWVPRPAGPRRRPRSRARRPPSAGRQGRRPLRLAAGGPRPRSARRPRRRAARPARCARPPS